MEHPTVKLYNYHVWANKLVFDHVKKLPEGTAETEVQNAFPNVLAVLAHIYAVDEMWLSVIRGATFDEARAVVMRANEEAAEMKLGGQERKFDETADKYRAFLADGRDLDRTIPVFHPKIGEQQALLGELVQHVVNHGTYHRGQVTSILRQLGHAGVPTDYAFYMFE
ncbi:DinB family protein [Paenibacillus humicola]|uniref:DinB family protein n=1 Tax=Paenibacillus humicola TaxID=3110540 RepID=UPI00237AA518|nr:DinB family protein [Paenibacillus humicola]